MSSDNNTHESSTQKSSNALVPALKELFTRCDGNDQAERMDAIFRAVIAVPKAAIEKEEAKWKKVHAKKHQRLRSHMRTKKA